MLEGADGSSRPEHAGVTIWGNAATIVGLLISNMTLPNQFIVGGTGVVMVEQ